MLKLAEEKNAYFLFGMKPSFLNGALYLISEAQKGQKPAVRTSGKRRGYQVFGLINTLRSEHGKLYNLIEKLGKDC
jgi:hypothetical protein